MSLWFEGGVKFSCIGCGRCCRGEPGAIWFTQSEAQHICALLGISEEEFRAEFTKKLWGHDSIIERKNGDCFFYDPDSAKCVIYDVRPAQCRLFPFWISVMESQNSWNEAAKSCPGMNDGELHGIDEILSKLSENPFNEL